MYYEELAQYMLSDFVPHNLDPLMFLRASELEFQPHDFLLMPPTRTLFWDTTELRVCPKKKKKK